MALNGRFNNVLNKITVKNKNNKYINPNWKRLDIFQQKLCQRFIYDNCS